jgi:DNA gyrase subunit A
LISTYRLSERQANAILEMRLQRLTGLEQEKIETEYQALLLTIDDLRGILASESRIYDIIKEEQHEIKEKFNDKRRSEIIEAVEHLSLEDLIPRGQVAILISKNGFVKRMPIDIFRSQQRGGRGVSGMTTRDTDVIEHLLITSTHDYILFFSTIGRVFKIKAYELPEVSRLSKGVSIAHFLNMQEGEFLSAAIELVTFDSSDYLLMCTKKGVVKKTEVLAYKHFKNRPIIAINLDKGDILKWVKKTDGNQDIVLTTTAGMLIRFEEAQARPLGRASRGVKGIKIRPEDELVCMNVISKDSDEKLFVLTITKYGYGKNIQIDEFKCQNRAGIGVKSIKFRKTLKDDCVKDTVITTKEDEIMIVTRNGTITRQKVRNISTQRRGSQGVTIMKMDKGDEVIAMTCVVESPELEESEKE